MTYKCLVLLSLLGFITGCWDRNEMDDLALVIASGLDITEDGQLEITLQIALPTGIPSAVQTGGGEHKSVLVISAKGSSTAEANNRLQQQLSRIIYYGHREVIVIGEKYARQGLNMVLDTFTRLPESRYNSYIVTACGATAKEILNLPYQLELIPGIGIMKIQSNKFSFPVKIDEFLNALSSQTKSPITAAISIINKDTDIETFSIDRIAVYRGNKLSGFLSADQLNLLRWWADEAKHMLLTAQVEPKDDEYKGTVGVEILKSKSKIHTVMKDGIPQVSMLLQASVRSVHNDSRLDLSKVDNMKRVETRLSEEIKIQAEKMLELLQKKFKSDLLGIGEEIHVQHPYVWKTLRSKWIDIYPTVPVAVDVDIKITRTGKTQSPAHMKKTD